MHIKLKKNLKSIAKVNNYERKKNSALPVIKNRYNKGYQTLFFPYEIGNLKLHVKYMKYIHTVISKVQ